MEAITRHNLIDQLLKAVPEFSTDPEDVRDNLIYLIFHDLAQFVNSLLESQNQEELLNRIFDFIEMAAKSKDEEIRPLLRDAFNELAIQHPENVQSYMGRHTRKIFQQAKEDVYGGASIVGRTGRSIKGIWSKR